MHDQGRRVLDGGTISSIFLPENCYYYFSFMIIIIIIILPSFDLTFCRAIRLPSDKLGMIDRTKQ